MAYSGACSQTQFLYSVVFALVVLVPRRAWWHHRIVGEISLSEFVYSLQPIEESDSDVYSRSEYDLKSQYPQIGFSLLLFIHNR